MTVTENVNARVDVKWIDEREALVYVGLGLATLVGALKFDAWKTRWEFHPTADEGDNWLDPRYIDVDPSTEAAFLQERVNFALERNEATRDALQTEWNGRVAMHRDESRDVAILGAKIEARKWVRELDAGDAQFAADFGSVAPTPAGPWDAPDPDVKARRNYKAMKEVNLIDAYRQLIHGGEARRRTLDWQGDIPFVREVMRDKYGLDPDAYA